MIIFEPLYYWELSSMMKIKLLTHVPQDRNNLGKNNPKTVFKGYLGSKESIQLCSAVIKLSERFPGIPERFPKVFRAFSNVFRAFTNVFLAVLYTYLSYSYLPWKPSVHAFNFSCMHAGHHILTKLVTPSNNYWDTLTRKEIYLPCWVATSILLCTSELVSRLVLKWM